MSYSLLSSSSCLSTTSSSSISTHDMKSQRPLLHSHHMPHKSTACHHDEYRMNEYSTNQLDVHRLELKLDLFSHDKQQQINEIHKEMITMKQTLMTEIHKLRLDMQQELKLMEQRFAHQLQLITTQLQKQQQQPPPQQQQPPPQQQQPSMIDSYDHDEYHEMRQTPSWFWPSYDFIDADCHDNNMSQHHNTQHMMTQRNIRNTPIPPTASVASNIVTMKQTMGSTSTPIPPTETPPIEDMSDPAVAAASSAPLITPHTRKGSITETNLVALATRILSKHGSVPVGKMGSLLHKAANNHALPALLKERYGGLKKFLQSHQQYFVLGEDHPYNPHVSLKSNEKNTTTTTTTTETTDTTTTTEATSSSVESSTTGTPSTPDITSPLSHGSTGSGNTPPLLPLSRTPQRDTPSTTPPSTPHTDRSVSPNFSNCLAIDCEMVGIGPNGTRSCLARCSIVNYHGQVIYDQYVRPTEVVTDYRTHVSGIRASDLENALEFGIVQKQVAHLIKDRIIIAHSVVADLQALLLSHPPHLIRDTAFFPLLCPSRPRSLKHLVKERLGIDFQNGEHDSVEDARAVLAVYKSCATEWENLITNGGITHTSTMTTSSTTTTTSSVKDGSPLSTHAMDVLMDTYHHHQKNTHFFY